MTWTLDDQGTNGAMELEQFIELLKASAPFDTDEQLAELSAPLIALARNRSFLSKWLNAEMVKETAFGNSASYVATSVVLFNDPAFQLRVNLWPSAGTAGFRPDVQDYLSYAVAHDHNFSFITAGYTGPGYATSIYEYDRARYIGVPGEAVALDWLEDTSLTQEKCMLYRCGRDVHTQGTPEALSTSINVLVQRPAAQTQLLFDLEKELVVDSPSIAEAGATGLCSVAAMLGDEDTFDALKYLADRGTDPRERWAAVDAARSMTYDPDSISELLISKLADPDAFVQVKARSALAELQAI